MLTGATTADVASGTRRTTASAAVGRLLFARGARGAFAFAAADLLRLLQMMQAELQAGATAVDSYSAAAAHDGGNSIDARFANPFERMHSRDPAVDRVRACCAELWDLHLERGLALSPLLKMAEEVLARVADAREHVRQETAGIRASATMLSILPAISPLLGLLLGCNPLGWLMSTIAGAVVAGTSVLLLVANHIAVTSIARRAVR